MINLKSVKDTLNAWRSALTQMESDLESALQRLSYLLESPLQKNELADLVVASMTGVAEQAFNEHLEIKLRAVVNNPMDDLSSRWFPMLANHSSGPTDVDGRCLFWALRVPIGEAIREAIEKWPDLPEAGPPKAERLVEIPKLEKKIARLRERIDLEHESARTAGLNVSGLGLRRADAKSRKG